MNHEDHKVSEQTQGNNELSETMRNEIVQAAKDCFSKSIENQKRGCNALVVLLKVDTPTDQIIASGVVPQLLQFLRPEVNLGDKDLLLDALVALGNIGVY